MRVISVSNKFTNNNLSLKSNGKSLPTSNSVVGKPYLSNFLKNPYYAFSINFTGLKPQALKKFAVSEANPLWDKLTAREVPSEIAKDDYRSLFDIDYDRILHSGSYGRMRFKTQVFSNPKNDVISSRLTHVEQVSSIAQQIAEHLGLNAKLTRAIAIGHDVGHAPFGHSGEHKLNEIAKTQGLDFTFWHEKNSLRFLDDIETKMNTNGKNRNLNLTYAVRDGIISHCGEIDENGLRPRREYLDLRTVKKTDKIMPFTWEGCVMRLSDKIAYIGKDLEDAAGLGILNEEKLGKLRQEIAIKTGLNFEKINNSVLIKHFISDLLKNSSPEKGLCFSEPTFKMMNITKAFNYKEIYMPKDKLQGPYLDMVIDGIFNKLDAQYAQKDTVKNLDKMAELQPKLAKDFKSWLQKYSDIEQKPSDKISENRVIYSIENQKDYKQSIIEFISGLTDRGALDAYDSIIFPY